MARSPDKSVRSGQRINEVSPKDAFLGSLKANKIIRVINGLLNCRIEQGDVAGFTFSDQNAILTLPTTWFTAGDATSLTLFHPFKVYNCDVPTSAPAGTQKWQCWQVRCGFVAARSKFVIAGRTVGGQNEAITLILTGTDGGASGINQALLDLGPNYPNVYFDFQNPNTVASYYFSPATGNLTAPQIVLVGNDDAGYSATEDGGTCTFIIPAQFDGLNAVMAGFWIELTDDPTGGMTGKVKCRLWSNDQPSPLGRTDAPFANQVNIIPIAQLDPREGDFNPGDPTDQVAFQYIYDHYLNRRVQSTAFTPIVDWRGQTGPDTFTDDFGGQVFYDNEQITVFYPAMPFAGVSVVYIAVWSAAGLFIANECPQIFGSSPSEWLLVSVGFQPAE